MLARFYGIVIRSMCVRPLGTRLHAFYKGSELEMNVKALRVIQGDVPPSIRVTVVEWARCHYRKLVRNLAMMLHRQRPVLCQMLGAEMRNRLFEPGVRPPETFT